MDQSDPDTVMSARDEVLTRGLIDWVPLQRLHYHTSEEYPSDPVATTQQRVLDLVRSLIDEGLVELGDLNGPDDRLLRGRRLSASPSNASARSMSIGTTKTLSGRGTRG